MIRETIRQVVDGANLSEGSARAVMTEIMSGSATPSQISSFITAMRMKGETEEELFGFASVMREKAVRITSPDDAVDLCGTGGDCLNTFNISTVASFVVSAAGVPVAKHGNRSVSSRSGSADMLRALGIPFDLDPPSVERCLNAVNFGFMFAPVFNGSMKNAAVPRREIGIRTFFNLLGPMANPAGVKHQLIGVYDAKLAPIMARVLERLGTSRALVVNSQGMDEISNTGETRVVELNNGEISEYRIAPERFGLDLADDKDITGGGPFENARLALSILRGERSPRRDIVALNAGAAIYAADRVSSIKEGVAIASETIENGDALRKLEEFASVSFALEKERQDRLEADKLIRRRILGAVLTKRSPEIVAQLLKEIKQDKRGIPYLRSLDKQLLSNPSALSVIVLSRIRRIMKEGFPKTPHLEKSTVSLSDAISSATGLAVIGEYKPRSPSSSLLMVPPSPDGIAEIYSSSGVTGASVLIEPDYFSGGIGLFGLFRSKLSIPLLFKDFIFSKEQIGLAGRIGADSALLIAKALSRDSLDLLIQECIDHNMEPLVELHDLDDIGKLAACDTMESVRLVGINARNLESLETDLSLQQELRKQAPAGKILIAESGIRSAAAVKKLRGFDAALIGSMFMQAENPAKKVAEIVSAARGMKS